MPSMDKHIMNIFLKVLQVGSKFLNKEVGEKGPDGKSVMLDNKSILLKYGAGILDKERYKDLETLVN